MSINANEFVCVCSNTILVQRSEEERKPSTQVKNAVRLTKGKKTYKNNPWVLNNAICGWGKRMHMRKQLLCAIVSVWIMRMCAALLRFGFDGGKRMAGRTKNKSVKKLSAPRPSCNQRRDQSPKIHTQKMYIQNGAGRATVRKPFHHTKSHRESIRLPLRQIIINH